MANEAKRGAQDALFTAIQDQAETNMKSALKATEKAELLRDLAEAYRFAAGGPASENSARRRESADGSGAHEDQPDRSQRPSRHESSSATRSADKSSDDEQGAEEEAPRRRPVRKRRSTR